MHKRQLPLPVLIAAGLSIAIFAVAPTAGARTPAAGKLAQFFPSKVAGWKAGAIEESTSQDSHSFGRDYIGSGETKVTASIARLDPKGEYGLPKMEATTLGDVDGIGHVSFVTVNGLKGSLTIKKDDNTGGLFFMAGNCAVSFDAWNITESQLMSVARAFDMKGIEAECR
ncbi:MAG: hypothetical protein ACXWJM_15790 [Ramlibacter sp.]